MTERKPPGVSWESWFEEQIRQAQEGGAFENLPGAGKPLPDLEESSGRRAMKPRCGHGSTPSMPRSRR